MSMRILVACAAIGTSTLMMSAGFSSAATIATWTFETSVPTTAGPLSPEIGNGTATSVHATTTGTHTNPSGNGSAESWNSNTWAVGDYYQFQVSTLGMSGLKFSWDQTRSAAGPGQPAPSDPNFRLQYSNDGVNFTDHVDYLVQALTWDSNAPAAASQFSENLSSVTALDNQAAVYVRLTAIQSPQNSGGQCRVDSVSVTTVPEPGILVLWLAAAICLSLVGRPIR